MNTKALYTSILVMLFTSNLYQVYNYQTCKAKLSKVQTVADSALAMSKGNNILQENFFETLSLQNLKLNVGLHVLDIYGYKKNFCEIIKAKPQFVLYFNEIGCSSCNIEKINLVVRQFEKSGISDYLVLANFNSFNEFAFVINSSNLNKYHCYNSAIELKTTNYRFDKLLLFILDDSKTIKYPFIVNTDNSLNIAKYFNTLVLLKII